MKSGWPWRVVKKLQVARHFAPEGLRIRASSPRASIAVQSAGAPLAPDLTRKVPHRINKYR